jgi:predicted transcriptional regulator YdeE
MSKKILLLRNNTLCVDLTAARAALNSLTHVKGQPVVIFYGDAADPDALFAIGTRAGVGGTCYKILPAEDVVSALADAVGTLSGNLTTVSDSLSGKVDKISGKGLSTNDFTTEEKQKLAGLESSKFKGEYTSYEALSEIEGFAGAYAYVDEGAGEDVVKYIWDTTDEKWVAQQGESTAETPASIKSKYESNEDTNAFTDDEKAKLSGLENYDDSTLASAISTAAARIGKVKVGSSDSSEDYLSEKVVTDAEADYPVAMRIVNGKLLLSASIDAFDGGTF